jgi:hypothetical protein
MGNCRIGGKERELRDVYGNTPHSTTFLNKAMDRWRKKQESSKKGD